MSRLYRLAAQEYAGDAVSAAVFGRHERHGAKLASFAAVAVVMATFLLLGWPSALAGAGVAGVINSLRCDSYVLVVTPAEIRLHRPPRVRWFRVPLGIFDRAIGPDRVSHRRSGLLNDTWNVDGVDLLISRTQSRQLALSLSGRPLTPPSTITP